MVPVFCDQGSGDLKDDCTAGPIVAPQRLALDVAYDVVAFDSGSGIHRPRDCVHVRAEHPALASTVAVQSDDEVACVASILALALSLICMYDGMGHTGRDQMLCEAGGDCRLAAGWARDGKEIEQIFDRFVFRIIHPMAPM